MAEEKKLLADEIRANAQQQVRALVAILSGEQLKMRTGVQKAEQEVNALQGRAAKLATFQGGSRAAVFALGNQLRTKTEEIHNIVGQRDLPGAALLEVGFDRSHSEDKNELGNGYDTRAASAIFSKALSVVQTAIPMF